LEDAHAQLQAAHQRLEEEHGQLQATAELVERRYRLVCNILNGKPAENPALSELKSWFAGEFARDVQR
ncbi:hypothetical protein, partial [Stenotrophomonas maltophilia]